MRVIWIRSNVPCIVEEWPLVWFVSRSKLPWLTIQTFSPSVGNGSTSLETRTQKSLLRWRGCSNLLGTLLSGYSKAWWHSFRLVKRPSEYFANQWSEQTLSEIAVIGLYDTYQKCIRLEALTLTSWAKNGLEFFSKKIYKILSIFSPKNRGF